MTAPTRSPILAGALSRTGARRARGRLRPDRRAACAILRPCQTPNPAAGALSGQPAPRGASNGSRVLRTSSVRRTSSRKSGPSSPRAARSCSRRPARRSARWRPAPTAYSRRSSHSASTLHSLEACRGWRPSLSAQLPKPRHRTITPRLRNPEAGRYSRFGGPSRVERLWSRVWCRGTPVGEVWTEALTYAFSTTPQDLDLPMLLADTRKAWAPT